MFPVDALGDRVECKQPAQLKLMMLGMGGHFHQEIHSTYAHNERNECKSPVKLMLMMLGMGGLFTNLTKETFQLMLMMPGLIASSPLS